MTAGDAGAAAVERAAEIVAEHDWFTPRGYAWPCCPCGAEFTGGEDEAYRHVAEALAAANLLAAPVPTGTWLCSQCEEMPSVMVKIGTTDGWCETCLDLAAYPVWAEPTERQPACPCPCHGGHVGTACRENRCEVCAPVPTGTAHEEPLREAIEALILELNADADYRVPKRIVGDRLRAVLASHDTGSGQ